jgi:hypothetical protein
MKKFNLLFLICCVGMLSSCAKKNQIINFKDADPAMLLGLWYDEEKKVYEEWFRVNEIMYRGSSYKLTAKAEKKVLENIRMFKIKDTWVYEPTVPNQNEGKPIVFTYVPDPVFGLRFENREHDFPQLITYKKIDANHIIAEVSSFNAPERLTFKYQRLVTQ